MSRESVIRRIVEWDQAGKNLTEEAVVREAPDLYQAASKPFGAWETALQYAGIGPRRLSAMQEYTPEAVLRRIRRLCRDGYSLKAVDNMRRDRRLYDTARRYFGDWRKALEAAGVHLQYAGLRGGKPRRLDKEKTLSALRDWLAAGHSRSWLDLCLQNHELALAVKSVCGSWRRAMIAVGLLPETKPRARKQKWTPQRVITGIRLRHQEGKPMHYMAMHVDANPLLCAAKKYFGNWQNALAAAGIETAQRLPGRPRKKGGGL
jgi:hypothetical protein